MWYDPGPMTPARPHLAARTLLVLTLAGATPARAQEPSPPPNPATLPASNPPPATLPVDPATAARLAQLGSRNLRLHDPSIVVRHKDEHWLFSTGAGTPTYRSKDLLKWERGPRAFPEAPKWIRDVIPANRNGNDFWAPEVLHHDGRYLLYYSVSSWGKNTSAIALASNPTLDPADANYQWTDHGVVFRSTAGKDNYNAIDPAPLVDTDGRLWLAFGSFWGGIHLVELDPKTGLRLAPDSPVHRLANKEQIEGPFIHRRGDHYYLFVAWGWCCRGVRSTYNIRVGRADKVTGPYLDRDGKDMASGGGTLLLGSDGPFVGPGQPGVFTDFTTGQTHLVCHFYDAAQRGRGTLAIRPLTWDAAGWPVVELTTAPVSRDRQR